jgi:Transglycosylase SLT domain/D-alanyl-D-alanine carboxypeptidase
MPAGTYEHPLLGKVAFKTKSATWVRGDPITFTSGFDPSTEVEIVEIPQLKNVAGASGGRFRFHLRAHAQLRAAFEEIEKKGLLPLIVEFGGGFNPRLRKPTDGSTSKLPSNHSFGLAVDINPNDGTNGGTAAPLAPVFASHGFLWGQSFNDPMHFEVRTFEAMMEMVRGLDIERRVGTPPGIGLEQLSGFIAEQAKLFPHGLANLDVKWNPEGGLSLQMNGLQRQATRMPADADSFVTLAGTRLTYEQVTKLVVANNRCQSDLVSTEILVSLIWKESGFDPAVTNSTSTATGLMQVTVAAVKDVNNNTPASVHYEHSGMTDAAKNIQCGSFYLGLRIKWADGKLKEGLEGYGTGRGYADDILDCAKCLTAGGNAPASCLGRIHD